jgi:hypothetical protein
MKKILFLMLAGMLTAGASHGQKLSKKFSFGFGLEGGPTTGVISNTYGGAGGLTLRASYHIGPGFATLTSGYLGYFPKSLAGGNLSAGTQFPIKAGYKYIFLKHLFAMGELGYSKFTTYYLDFAGNSASASTGGFTYAPAVGVQFGAFEAGVRYEATAVTGGSYGLIGVRLGFNF